MQDKDWTGNSHSIYVTLGASNHTEKDRVGKDYYATEPKATELLLAEEAFSKKVWEPACGGGHMAKVLIERGYDVRCTDITEREMGNVPYDGNLDFLEYSGKFSGDIVTNPPYKIALDFIKKAISVIETGHKVAMFLKLQFLEGKSRKKFFSKHPPQTVYVSSSRLICAGNGDFDKYKSSAVAYAWFVWQKGYKGDTVIRWIN